MIPLTLINLRRRMLYMKHKLYRLDNVWRIIIIALLLMFLWIWGKIVGNNISLLNFSLSVTERLSLFYPRCKTLGAIHSTKLSGNFGLKLNGSVRSNRKSFEKTSPPFEVVLFFRSDRSEFWSNGSRPRLNSWLT